MKKFEFCDGKNIPYIVPLGIIKHKNDIIKDTQIPTIQKKIQSSTYIQIYSFEYYNL